MIRKFVLISMLAIAVVGCRTDEPVTEGATHLGRVDITKPVPSAAPAVDGLEPVPTPIEAGTPDRPVVVFTAPAPGAATPPPAPGPRLAR